MQGSRFEQKYIVTEERALQVRDFIRSRLELDEHGVGKPNFSYPVHSLYLDSDDLKLYWGTINGDRERFKLRLRFYDDNPVKPVFFEIKARMNNKCRTKKRAAVSREAVEWLLAGDTPRPSHLASDDPEGFAVLKEFCERIHDLQARPRVHIGYFREAYMSPYNDSARLTIDRGVRAEPELAARLSTTIQKPTLLWGQDVVLEMKITDRFPDSFRELISTFGLRQCGAAKYVDSVSTLGEYKFGGPSAT